jgi:hypothetical protein
VFWFPPLFGQIDLKMARCCHCKNQVNPKFVMPLGQSFVVLDEEAFQATPLSFSLSDSGGVGASLRAKFRQLRVLNSLQQGSNPPRVIMCNACETVLSSALDAEIDDLTTRISTFDSCLREVDGQLTMGNVQHPLSASISNLLQRPSQSKQQSTGHGLSLGCLSVRDAMLISTQAKARRKELEKLDEDLLDLSRMESDLTKSFNEFEESLCANEVEESSLCGVEADLLASCEGVHRELEKLNFLNGKPASLVKSCFDVKFTRHAVTVNGIPLEAFIDNDEGGGNGSWNEMGSKYSHRARFSRREITAGWNEACSLVCCARGAWGLHPLAILQIGTSSATPSRSFNGRNNLQHSPEESPRHLQAPRHDTGGPGAWMEEFIAALNVTAVEIARRCGTLAVPARGSEPPSNSGAKPERVLEVDTSLVESDWPQLILEIGRVLSFLTGTV